VPLAAQILFDRGGVLGGLAGVEDLRRRDALAVFVWSGLPPQ